MILHQENVARLTNPHGEILASAIWDPSKQTLTVVDDQENPLQTLQEESQTIQVINADSKESVWSGVSSGGPRQTGSLSFLRHQSNDYFAEMSLENPYTYRFNFAGNFGWESVDPRTFLFFPVFEVLSQKK